MLKKLTEKIYLLKNLKKGNQLYKNKGNLGKYNFKIA